MNRYQALRVEEADRHDEEVDVSMMGVDEYLSSTDEDEPME